MSILKPAVNLPENQRDKHQRIAAQGLRADAHAFRVKCAAGIDDGNDLL